MVEGMSRPKLRVEDNDHLHCIIHILTRHGIDYDIKPQPVKFPLLEKAGNIEELLKIIPTEIRVAGGLTTGFVADSNADPARRWEQIRDRLRSVGADAPDTIASDGYIGWSEKYRTQTGVWMMPDNNSPGAIEEFLEQLISDDDPLIEHARESVEKAIQIGAEFAGSNKSKAVLHTWLAFQKRPGMPYGVAMKAKYFEHNSDLANSFVDWFKRLYKIE